MDRSTAHLEYQRRPDKRHERWTQQDDRPQLEEQVDEATKRPETTIVTSNYLPDIRQHLSAAVATIPEDPQNGAYVTGEEASREGTAKLEIMCACCKERKLDISHSAMAEAAEAEAQQNRTARAQTVNGHGNYSLSHVAGCNTDATTRRSSRSSDDQALPTAPDPSNCDYSQQYHLLKQAPTRPDRHKGKDEPGEGRLTRLTRRPKGWQPQQQQEQQYQQRQHHVPSRPPPAERTVVLPCGHLLGARCMGALAAEAARCPPPSPSSGGGGSVPSCPTCGFRLAYGGCGHAIAPVLVTAPSALVDDCSAGRGSRVPPAPQPSACKECRWRRVAARARHALRLECVLCQMRAVAGADSGAVPAAAGGDKNVNGDAVLGRRREHERHRREHLDAGVRAALGELVRLLWPGPEPGPGPGLGGAGGSDEDGDGGKGGDDRLDDRRAANAALLGALVREGKLDETVWSVAATSNHGSGGGAEGVRRAHAKALDAFELELLRWLMRPDEGNWGR